MIARVPLRADGVGAQERVVLGAGGLSAGLFRYESGIVGLRMGNRRGSLVVLPWVGQMIWRAGFDGVELGMRSGFGQPVPSTDIAGTYGCFAFHSGLLRNGVPGAGDDHAAHGEFPCAAMQSAWLELVEDGAGVALRVVSEREHVVGFGPRYLARPSVTLREDSAVFGVGLEVENRSGKPMELMYMAHVNFAFVTGGEIVQAAPFDAEHVAVRRSVRGHVTPDERYLGLIEELAVDPGRMRRLDEPGRYDPEQVFYVRGLGTDAAGRTALMLARPQGDGFWLCYSPDAFPHCVRWVLNDPDQAVAAFALPSTCEPEGYLAERAKGHVRMLPPYGGARFSVELGYLDAEEAGPARARIDGLRRMA